MRSLLLTAVFTSSFLATTSHAKGFAPENPVPLEVFSDNSIGITGPIILSSRWVVFGNGERLDLVFVRDLEDNDLSPELYRISGEAGPLLNDRLLCEGETPRHVVVEREFAGETLVIQLSYFHDGDEPGAGDAKGSPCAVFSYAPTLGWIDAIKQVAEAENPSEPAASKGKWETHESVNPVDDTRTVMARLVADSGESRYGDSVEFYARCKSNKTEAYVDWNSYLGNDSGSPYSDYKRVTVRIGDAPAKVQNWGTSTDSKATFAPDWAGDLLKKMMAADKMVLQVIPYGESPVTAIFDTRGMDVALQDLASTCNWSY